MVPPTAKVTFLGGPRGASFIVLAPGRLTVLFAVKWVTPLIETFFVDYLSAPSPDTFTVTLVTLLTPTAPGVAPVTVVGIFVMRMSVYTSLSTSVVSKGPCECVDSYTTLDI